MNKRTVIVLCSTFLSVPPFINSPFAQEATPSGDAKRYVAAECGAANFPQLTLTDKGQALNKSTVKSLKIICPIVNDNVQGSGLEEVNIWLQKANSKDTMCWVHASLPSQQGGFYSFEYTNLPGRSVPLRIDTPFKSNVTWINDTHYTLGCNTAARTKSRYTAGTGGYSGINSYWILERP